MFKLLKVILGIILFIIIAAIIFVVVLVIINWNNKPKKKETSTTNKMSTLSSLTINVDVKDAYVHVKKSKTEFVNITYYDCKTRAFDVTEEKDAFDNETLTIKGYQTGKWYNRIFFTFNTTKVYGVTIEVPDDASVNVKTENGNIRFEEVYLNMVTADVYNGAAIFNKSNANICSLNSINGNIEVSSSNVGAFYCRTRKGRVVLDTLNATLTASPFIDASTDNGKIKLTNISCNGDISLHSGKGSIEGLIRVSADDFFKINAKANNGISSLTNTTTGEADLIVTTDNGNIDVTLKKV